jgi:aminopeptidase-like protein
VLQHAGSPCELRSFTPQGYDERQYCSPGFNLPVGLFQRSKFGAIPQYHTSADNLDFISPEHLGTSYRLITAAIDTIEANQHYRNTMPKCEPQLGRRGLYGAIGGDKDAAAANMAMLWVLNLSDGTHSLLDIAERSDLSFPHILRAAELLRDHDLLQPIPSHSSADQCGPGLCLMSPRSVERKSVQCRSLSDISPTGNGHEIPNAGSSWRTPLAASGA